MTLLILLGIGAFLFGYTAGAAVMAWRLKDTPAPAAPAVLLPEDALRSALVKAFRQAGEIRIDNRIELGNAVMLMESSTDDAGSGKRLN